PDLEAKAFASWADAIVLDFDKPTGLDWQASVRSRMPAAIGSAARGGASVFVRANCNSARAELDAAVFLGIAGVVLKQVRDAQGMVRAAEHLAELEATRGIEPGSLEIDVEIDNAAAVWHALEIARASDRFGAFLLNEPALCNTLGMQASPELDFDPLDYVKSQLITAAISVGGQALGMSYPLGLTGERASDEVLRAAVRRARDTGLKGALCPDASWIAACNEGFRPSVDEAAYYEKVIEVFAEGLARGMASVPLDGKMIDVPVDLRAKVYLAWANRANARDEQKAAAHRAPAARSVP
ncbi:MAG: aldolase/citrate lyase family protein, partial [Burkholderiales bacterium]